MAKTPTEVRFPIPEELQDTFSKFNTLAVLQGKRVPEAYAELAAVEVAANADLLELTWLPWEDFKTEMAAAGFTLNRTTFWKYRNKGYFNGCVRENGVNTLFQLEGILAFYRGETGKVTEE